MTPDQRDRLYQLEAERVGIHKPILFALYQAHRQPNLSDGETGLGISPANRITLEAVNTFQGQIHYAANTLRSFTDSLAAQGWTAEDMWQAEQGRYTESLVQSIAQGCAPPTSEISAARLERCDSKTLLQAYLADTATDYKTETLPANLAYVDQALLTLVAQIPNGYRGLSHQREAVLEALRIWQRLADRATTIAALSSTAGTQIGNIINLSESHLDPVLLQSLQHLSHQYSGYPHQREALLRLSQIWFRLESRAATIAWLSQDPTAEPTPQLLDPALIAFVQRLPQIYEGKGVQRNALVEGFRLWRQLDSRAAALVALGTNPDLLSAGTQDRATLMNTASQLDRELLEFIRRVPAEYQAELHRESLIRLVQMWRDATHEQMIASLLDDLKRMSQARRDSLDAPPVPVPAFSAKPPAAWHPDNLQLGAAIVPNGSFTWAEATQGGTYLPPDQTTVDAIVQMAHLVQQARDRIGRPFHVTRWYLPIPLASDRPTHSSYALGSAIEFYCDGLTGNQVYWFLDPWWPAGLGRYAQFPYLIHLSDRQDAVRWSRQSFTFVEK